MNIFTVYFWTAFFSLLPVSELRGAIPFAILNGVPWYIAMPAAVILNAAVAPICWLFLSTLNGLFLKMSWYKKFFERFIERARGKLHGNVERWGWLGVALFVAIPLPLTGAWTGTLGAWVLGLSWRRTMAAVLLGVIVSGAVVTSVMLLGVEALDLFIKKV